MDLSDVETIADANERLAGTICAYLYVLLIMMTLLPSTRGMQVTAGTYVGTSFEEETYA
ncbi:MAG: hypothetical protein ACLVJ6_10665 [Merdibacter sp.]